MVDTGTPFDVRALCIERAVIFRCLESVYRIRKETPLYCSEGLISGWRLAIGNKYLCVHRIPETYKQRLCVKRWFGINHIVFRGIGRFCSAGVINGPVQLGVNCTVTY